MPPMKAVYNLLPPPVPEVKLHKRREKTNLHEAWSCHGVVNRRIEDVLSKSEHFYPGEFGDPWCHDRLVGHRVIEWVEIIK